MAHVEPLGLAELEKMLAGMNTLGNNIDDVAKECVEAGSPLMESIYRNTMAGASPKLGKAAASTNTTQPKKNPLGVYAVSRAVGWNPRTQTDYPTFAKWEGQHKTRYAMIAALFNYGVGPHKIDFSVTNAYGNSAFVRNGASMHPGMNVSGEGWQSKAAKSAEGPVSQVVSRKFDEKVKQLLG